MAGRQKESKNRDEDHHIRMYVCARFLLAGIHVCICRYFLGNREVRDYLIMKWDRAKFSNEIFLLVVYCGYVG